MLSERYTAQKPDYANRGPSIVAVASASIAVSTVAVCARFWSRIVATRTKFWWDDAALLGTLVFSNAYLATMIWWTTVGYGKHMFMLPMSSIKDNKLASHLIVFFYIASINFIKISALTLYGRLFRVSRRMVYTLWAIGVIVVLWWVASEILPWFACHPVAKTLDPMIPGYCVKRIAYYHAVGLINPFLDIIILLLPLPMVWKLNMNLGRKILASLVFILGYCSAFLALVRFGMIFKNPKIMDATPGSDPTWDTIPLQIVSMLEAPLAIIALSGPPINQIIRRAKVFGWSSLFSTAQFPTPVVRSDTEKSDSLKSESKGSVFSRVMKKKSSKSDIPPIPQFDEGNNSMGNGTRIWDGNGSETIQMQRDVSAV